MQIVIRAEHDRQSMHNELVNTRTACDQLSREKVILYDLRSHTHIRQCLNYTEHESKNIHSMVDSYRLFVTTSYSGYMQNSILFVQEKIGKMKTEEKIDLYVPPAPYLKIYL